MRYKLCFYLTLLCLYAYCQPSVNITFSKDIAPIIFKNCSPCHRPGNIAPFSLLSYKDVKRKGKTIKLVTGKKYMPPYFADTHYSNLANPSKLSDKEIAMIASWVDNGMPYGDSLTKLPVPSTYESDNLGKPDLILHVDKISIKGDNNEKFYHIKVPYQLAKDELVCICEFVPGNRKVVHHMDAFQYNFKPGSNVFQGSNTIDGDLVKNDLEVIKQLKMLNYDGSLPDKVQSSVIDFFPGSTPVNYPKGIQKAYKMAKNGVILISTMHYGSSSIDTYDASKINIYFCKEKIQRLVYSHAFGSPTHKIEPELYIPANQIKKFKTYQEFTQDISLLKIQPHAHLLCKDILCYAITKQGKKIPLLKLEQWDLRWQRSYKFKYPIHIPAGSKLYIEGTYDNTVNNPSNPFNPPRNIPESIRTKDEMLQCWIDFMSYQPGDEKINLELK